MTEKLTRNFDKLDALILLAGDVLIEKEIEYANSIDTSDCELSKRTDRKIRRYIKQASKPHEQKMWMVATKRVAAVLLIMCTILFAGAMSVEAVRNEFMNAIIEWFDEYISVRFESSEETTAIGMIEAREPSYLPLGFDIMEKDINGFRNKITYEYNGEKSMVFIQRPSTTDVWIDDVGCSITDVEIKKYAGVLAIYSEGEVQYVLIWNDEIYSYILQIFANEKTIDKDELVKIAESLY